MEGMEWNGMEWNGMEWNGMDHGMEGNGMDGMDRPSELMKHAKADIGFVVDPDDVWHVKRRNVCGEYTLVAISDWCTES